MSKREAGYASLLDVQPESVLRVYDVCLPLSEAALPGYTEAKLPQYAAGGRILPGHFGGEGPDALAAAPVHQRGEHLGAVSPPPEPLVNGVAQVPASALLRGHHTARADKFPALPGKYGEGEPALLTFDPLSEIGVGVSRLIPRRVREVFPHLLIQPNIHAQRAPGLAGTSQHQAGGDNVICQHDDLLLLRTGYHILLKKATVRGFGRFGAARRRRTAPLAAPGSVRPVIDRRHIPPAPPQDQIPGEKAQKGRRRHAQPVVQNLPQGSHRHGEQCGHQGVERVEHRVDLSPHIVRKVVLDAALPEGGAVDSQETADPPVDQHQGKAQPEEDGVHQVVGHIHHIGEAEPLLRRDGEFVVDQPADGPAHELGGGEPGIHRDVQPWGRAKPGPDQGLGGLADPLGDGHVAIDPQESRLLLQIGEPLPEIPEVVSEREAPALDGPLLHFDPGLHRSGQEEQDSLPHTDGPQPHLVIEDAGHRRHHNGNRGVEHSGDRVALLGEALGDQVGVEAGIGQGVHRADGVGYQGYSGIQSQTEGVARQIPPHQQVNRPQQVVQPHDHRLAAEVVQIGGQQHRQQDPGQGRDGSEQGRGQGAAGGVEDHKAEGKAHGHPADGADDGAQGDDGEVLCPQSLSHEMFSFLPAGPFYHRRRREKKGLPLRKTLQQEGLNRRIQSLL